MKFVVTAISGATVIDQTFLYHEGKKSNLMIESKYASAEYIIDAGNGTVEDDGEFYVSGFCGYELVSLSAPKAVNLEFSGSQLNESEKESLISGYNSEGLSHLESAGWELDDQTICIEGGVEVEEYLLD